MSNSLFPGKVAFHYFENLYNLYQCHRHSHLDLIFFATMDRFDSEFRLIKEIKNHPTLQLVPLALFSPYPDKEAIIEGSRLGVD